MRAILPALALLSLIAAQADAAEKPTCIRHGDMRVLLRMALPDAIDGLAERCKPVLPADAFLPNEGAGLAERYRHEAPVDPARARRAVEAATRQDLSSLASDDTVLGLAKSFVSDQVEHHVPVKDCKQIDGLLELAGPLPADTMVEAILLGLQVAGPDQIKGLAICRPNEDMPPR